MNVGVMTWFHYHNYGTALQVTAMSKAIENIGHTPVIINYYPRQGVIKRSQSIVRATGKAISSRIKSVRYKAIECPERESRFESFYNKYLRFTEPCNLLSELESLNDKMEGFVCGSDQIWAPSVFDRHYWLDFVTDTEKMIAYAPSIGLERIDDNDIAEQIRTLAGRFAHLSTREKNGSEIVSRLINKRVETVLDPTMLLTESEWMYYEKKDNIMQEDYLLVYMLGNDEGQWKKIYKISRELELSVKIIPVYSKDYKRPGCITSPIGPAEFLHLLRGASFVCTDSFHGTIFSIIFRKQFLAFERFKPSDPLNQNSRIQYILASLSLMERCVSKRKKIIGRIFEKEINYSEVEAALNALVTHSKQYLEKALESIANKTVIEKKNHVKKNRSLCCGCGACRTKCPVEAIDIVIGKEGFYEVSIDEDKCVSCGKCREACPFIKNKCLKRVDEAMVFSAKDRNQNVLLQSSSGGVGFRLSNLALKRNMAVVGCAYNRRKHQAEHIVINDKNECTLMQGSKYLQSEFANALEECTKHNEVMIIGTPCQIAGARNLFGSRAIYVDLICHGVPSTHLYSKYLTYLTEEKKLRKENIDTVFRYKPKGWRNRYIYNTDGHRTVCTNQHKDPFYLFFEHGLCYSKACYECLWRDKSSADIRIGDYWGDKFKYDKTGVSMVIALSETGESWIEELKIEGNMIVSPQVIDDYFAFQQTRNTSLPVFWEHLVEDLKSEIAMCSIIREYAMFYERKRRLSKLYSLLTDWARNKQDNGFYK